MRLLVVSLALLEIGCAHTRTECPAHGGPPWREVTSAHFVVATDLDSDMAKSMVLDLEKARKALLLVFRTRADPPQQLQAIVLRSRSELSEFFEPQVLGLLTFDSHGPLIVASGTAYFIASEPDLRVVAHELAHLFAAYSFARQPRWFAEGLAGYLETMISDRSNNQMLLGEPAMHHFETVRAQGALGLEDLWAWDRNSTIPDGGYPSSWAWVHFLMNRHPDELGQFEVALSNAVEARQAWAAAFSHFTDQQLEEELRAYIRAGSYAVTRVDLKDVSSTLTERPLSNADVHAFRGQLAHVAFHAPRTPEQQRLLDEDIATALAFDETHLRASETKIAATPEGGGRLALARALVKAHPTQPDAWKALARSLENQDDAERIDAWRQVLVLRPHDVAALITLANAELRAKRPAVALPLISVAVEHAPWNLAGGMVLAEVLAALGRCDEAVEAAQGNSGLLLEGVPEKVHAQVKARIAEIRRDCRSPSQE